MPEATRAASPVRVLVADDQADVLEALRLLLKAEGFQPQLARSPAAILAAVEAQEFDALLMDLNYTRDTTSGREGLDLIARLSALDPTLPVVVMTAWGSVDGAVEAMRRGARDYIQKPWDNARLLTTLRTQIELAPGAAAQPAARERERAPAPRRTACRSWSPGHGRWSRCCGCWSGWPLGRERAHHRRARHRQGGRRPLAPRRLGRARCGRSCRSTRAALREGVFESELFGHVKGAFTDAHADRIGCFELADGGTLFLDEIGNMPLGPAGASSCASCRPASSSRVGSSRAARVDVRVLSATNADRWRS